LNGICKDCDKKKRVKVKLAHINITVMPQLWIVEDPKAEQRLYAGSGSGDTTPPLSITQSVQINSYPVIPLPQ